MIQGNSILVVVPARGGSKGIKLKNLQEINNKSLVEITADLVRKLEFIDKAVLSTDHSKIADIGRRCGLDVPFMRPPHLSQDIVSDTEVLSHALLEMEEKEGVEYQVIVMLQPTSPFRTKEHAVETVRKLINASMRISRAKGRWLLVSQVSTSNATSSQSSCMLSFLHA